jgi:Ni,Fe-hydrogenase III small subunit
MLRPGHDAGARPPGDIYQLMPEPMFVIAVGNLRFSAGVFDGELREGGIDTATPSTCTCPAAPSSRAIMTAW